MANKPFTRQAHAAHDPQAKAALLNSPKLLLALHTHLGLQGLFVNPDPYGVDFLTPDGRSVDVETKNDKGFRDGQFAFQSVHVPDRKRPLYESGTCFILFDKTYSWAIVIDSRVAHPWGITKPTKSEAGDEDFMAFPIGSTFCFKIRDEVVGPDVAWAPECPLGDIF